MDLFDVNQEIKNAKSRFVINLVLVSLFILVCLAINLLLFLFSKNNYLLPLILNIVITSACFICLIFYFGNIFPRVRHYYGYFSRLSHTTNIHKKVLVFDHELENKLRNGVRYRQLVFSYEEAGKKFLDKVYVLDENKFELKESCLYEITTFENTLIRYKEIKDAEAR